MNKLLWIDDEAMRKDMAKSIAETLTLECVYMSPDNVQQVLNGDMSNYDAIFIDHYLTRDLDKRETGYNKGASLCSELRVCCPDVPIFGISAAREDQLSQNEKSEYDLFATAEKYDELKLNGKIKSAVEGFAQFRLLRNPNSVSDGKDFIDVIIEKMGAPTEDLSVIRKILPSCLRTQETFNIHRAFQWISTKFLQKDGVLIWSRTIAAMIGLKEDAFKQKIKPKLLDCCYQGVFAFGDDIFWRSKVLAALANLTGNDGSIPLSHYCEKLEGVSVNDYAECIYCHKKYTELLAYEDRSPSAKTHPAHYDCAFEVEEGQSLYFDSDYLLKESN